MLRVTRGQYGPLPSEVISPRALRVSRWSLWMASFVGRRLTRKRALQDLSTAEREMVLEASHGCRFAPWIPRSVPAGFSVADVNLVKFSRDVLTLKLSDGAGRDLEVSQRVPWLPLLEELTTAGVPFDEVPGERNVFLMHGKYGGEPIDLSFWNSRRALVFELGGVRIECREVVGRGPGLSALIEFANAARRERRQEDSSDTHNLTLKGERK